MNPQFFHDILQCFESANQDEDLRVVILTGNGKHFSAGLDLNEANLAFGDSGGTLTVT
jgi:enoyl-CoA hydratase/carnithine racemase